MGGNGPFSVHLFFLLFPAAVSWWEVLFLAEQWGLEAGLSFEQVWLGDRC